ncbi:cytochrome P450 [Paxillus ammoniavirescens]|nr:cytochrome P450 [Paxillus ammoniavirescens]
MLFTFHLPLTFALVYLLRFIHQRVSARRVLRRIPGPKNCSWLWGEEQNLYYGTPGTRYLEWHRKFGKVVRFSGAFGHQILSITDPRAINYILGEGTYQFPKPLGVRTWFRILLGEGILWVEGKEAHERQRRTLAPALSSQSVRNLTPMFYENASKMAIQWHKVFDACQDDEPTIEMTSWAGRFALDTIGRAAFSYDFKCLDDQPNALGEALDSLTNHEKTRWTFYIRALFWLVPWILHCGKKGQLIRKTRKELGDLALDILRDAKVVNDPNSKTLMSLMLKADKSAMAQHMDDEQVAAQMRTIISAGYEPVSATIAWFFYELAMNPERQQAIREEVSLAHDPSYDELNNDFPLLDAFFMETLRVHPPVLENHHQAAETISIPLSEPLPGTTDLHLIIPKDTVLSMPVNVIHSDRSGWGPDADIFRPERWLQRNTRNNRDLFAFSLGPRGCLGKNFATAEIKALAVTLLRQFSFTCQYDIECFQTFVIRPRIVGESPSSLPLRVRRISG